MSQKQHTKESLTSETTRLERAEERSDRRLRLQIEELEARIAPAETSFPPPPPNT